MKLSNTTPYIIAEIGINFEGKIKLAKKLILNAKKSDVSAVKFQLFEAKTLANKNSEKTKDQKKRTKSESLYKMWKRMELTKKDILLLKKYTKKLGMDFIVSVFDFNSLELAKEVGIDYLKVASSEINNLPLLKKISETNKKVIISTGMANEFEIKKCLGLFSLKNVFLLHCVSLYPCPENLANLNRMIKLKKFNCKVGYSDHCKGINASLIAISMGAKIIEKHFTLNKNSTGADHEISADYSDMKIITNYAKNFNLFKGKNTIQPSIKEIKMRKFFRKSIFYKKQFNSGKIIKLDDLNFLRPEKGLK